MNPNTNPLTLFDKQWAIYQKVIHQNVMYHQEIEDILTNYLSKFQNHPINMLDLGCGDSHIPSNIFKTVYFKNYLGIDLSEQAISAAKNHFKEKGINHTIENGNINFLQENILKMDKFTQGQTFNCIFSSYVIHHLSKEQKYQLYDAIYRSLPMGGWFIYIDLIKSKYVSLTTYLKRFSNYLNKWNAFSIEEKNLIIDHISTYDFPENEEQVLNYFEMIGFEKIFYKRFDTFHRIAIFQK